MNLTIEPLTEVPLEDTYLSHHSRVYLAKIIESSYRVLTENELAFLTVKYDTDEIVLDQYGLSSIDFRNGYYLKSNCVSCGRTYEREDGTILRKDSVILHGTEEDIISAQGDLKSVSPRLGLICKNCYDEIQTVIENWIETNPDEFVSHSI